MDSNTELIAAMAQQFGAYVRQALEQRQQAGESISLAIIEAEMRECLRRAGAQALSQVLSSVSGSSAAEQPCTCGGTLRYQVVEPLWSLASLGE